MMIFGYMMVSTLSILLVKEDNLMEIRDVIFVKVVNVLKYSVEMVFYYILRTISVLENIFF